MRKMIVLAAICAVAAVVVGCQSAPPTFVKTMEPSWATIELRTELQYEDAWNKVVDILVKRFDLEMVSKTDGYMRTNWLYTWTGQLNEDYRVRVTVKFGPDRKSVEIKSEAEYYQMSPWGMGMGSWVTGSDTKLLETLKTDIMGSVGRTTR